MGMPAPPFCSWLLPHSRVTAVDVNQFLKHCSSRPGMLTPTKVDGG